MGAKAKPVKRRVGEGWEAVRFGDVVRNVVISLRPSRSRVSLNKATNHLTHPGNGIGPGSILEWDQDGDQIVVRRSARFMSQDIHRALFPERVPKSRTVDDMKEGIRRRARERNARR